VVPYKNHMIRTNTRELMYLASSWTTFEHHHLYSYLLRVTRVGQFCFTGGLRARIGFTGFNRKSYGHGILFFLLCVLDIASSVALVPIASYSVASSLYATLPVALTIMHFDGTSIHSLIPSTIFI